MENELSIKPKPLLSILLVLSSIILLSFSPLKPSAQGGQSNRLDSFPPPQNLYVDTLACIAYWDAPEPGIGSLYYYGIALDAGTVYDFTDCTYYEIPQFLEYGSEHYIVTWAVYDSGMSVSVADTFTSGYLPIPRNLTAEQWENVVALTWEVPQRPDTTFPFVWYVMANYPTAGIPIEYGAETDGDYFYTTQSNGNLFFKYALDGLFIEQFTISGVSNIKDLAYNPNNNLFYGGDGNNICYIMDFNTHTLEGTIIAPANIRAIAYDDYWDAFWVSSWTTGITLFDTNGNLLITIPGNGTNYTGLAYDYCTEGGPYLWGFTSDYGGADIVLLDIQTGEHLYHTNINPILSVSGSPGGLYTHSDFLIQGYVTLGGCIQSSNIFGLELCPQWGVSWMMVPPNLLGYNLYLNDDLLDYIPYSGEDTTTYYDIRNNCYQYELIYDVRALYDMEPYGMAGDTGESYHTGIDVYFGLYIILPFEESWNSGGFEVYQWGHDENWTVSGQQGNPEPCAVFQGDLMLNDYKSALSSWCIVGTDYVGGPGFIDGNFWLNLDLKLESSTATGNELFYINIITLGDTVTIDTFSNAEGSFNWLSLEYNITEQAFNEIFGLQFEATGEHSADIMGWYLDNITIFRVCPEPTNLYCIEITPDEFLITWEAPDYEPPTFSKDQRDLNGYNIYVDNEYLDFTEDTFYYWNPTAAGEIEIGVSALYEDCESYQADTVISVSVGLSEFHNTPVLVYPNPSQGKLYLESGQKINTVKLFDQLGNIVLNRQFNENQIQLNIRHYNSGIYSINICLENGMVISRKIVLIQ